MAALMLALATGQAGAEPLARIEGVSDQALARALAEAVGEAGPRAENGADAPWRARARAREAADIIQRYLDSQGYYGAVIDPRVDDAGRALVRVRPGQRFVFDAIQVSWLTPPDQAEPPEAAAQNLALEPGAPVIASDVIAARARVIAGLHAEGFVEAREASHDIIVDHATQSARADFRFETGPFMRFGPPQFAGGLADLRPGFIARLAPYEIGEPASRAQLNEYSRRLHALQSVSVADVRMAPDEEDGLWPVDVRADPTPRHRIEGALRWSTSEGAGAEAVWTRRNVFRGDETLSAGVQAAELRQGVITRLTLPHWRRYAQDLTLGAELLAERTDAFDQDVLRLSATVSRLIAERLTLTGGVRAQTARVTDVTGTRSATTLALPAGAIWDGRDSLLDPQRGVYLDLGATPGWSFGGRETRYVRLEGGARYFFPVSDTVVLAARARAGSIVGTSPEALPPDERFYAGGGGSVRGYAYQSLSPERLNPQTGRGEIFGGRSLSEVSFEARWRRSERLGFAAFIDGGAARDDTAPDFSGMRFGAGLGVRYYPGFGPLRLDIATPLNRRSGDDPVQIYISIGQAF
ncbi:BamA/TamA family outer membrane protein [Alkalicaulis satelles]|uniref:BamA/TamA family outer membrane protein n=1 Tax=Alkalicaulis satelles TaxID=2609175 RepID=A0A5M6ZBW0_9PROT|nr:BamA/TamA family outer membrane protein [Alkalicaulis satelles]KAA5802203.1 BamA/TamA family outer membrane protein [Alkalicaulis satelles]